MADESGDKKEDEKPWWEVDDEEEDTKKAVGLDEVYQEIQLASCRLMDAATSVMIESAGTGVKCWCCVNMTLKPFSNIRVDFHAFRYSVEPIYTGD